MHKPNKREKTSLRVSKIQEGETMEHKMQRMMQQGADVNDVTELIFTERKEGVIPETDVRNEAWDVAVEATDAASRDHLTKRDARHNPPKKDGDGEATTDNVKE